MENGYQLATERLWPLLSDLTQVLEDSGYKWWTWKKYSYQVGTPQVRRRAFLCATRDTIKRPELIDITAITANKNRAASPTLPWLQDLIGIKPSAEAVKTREGRLVSQHWYGPASSYHLGLQETIAKGRQYVDHGYTTPRDVEKLKKLAAEGDVDAAQRLDNLNNVWEECPAELQGMSMFRLFTIKFLECAPAIIGSYKYVHPIDDRVLTMREMARLMGYPDDFEFHDLNPSFIAQGIPVNNAKWGAERLMRVVGID
jgi:site-specific DNA-cytosine methylase